MLKIKRYLFQKTESGLSEELTHRLLTAALAQKQFSRTSLAEEVGISEVSAGKLVNSLEECGFTCFSSKRPAEGGRIRRIHSLRDYLNTAVLSLAQDRYTLTLLSPSLEPLLHTYKLRDLSLRKEDDLTLFLSRAAKQVRERGEWPVAVAVMLPAASRPDLLFPPPDLFGIEHRAFLDVKCAKLLGSAPILYADIKEALRAAVDYRLLPAKPGVAYLKVGASLSVGYCDQDRCVHILRANDLLVEDQKRIGDILPALIFDTRYGELLARAVNLVDCCYDCSAYLIESERFHTGSNALKQLKRQFALSGAPLPAFFFCSPASSYLTQGLALRTLSLLIEHHLIPLITE